MDKEKLISGIIGGIVAGFSIGVGFMIAQKTVGKVLNKKKDKDTSEITDAVSKGVSEGVKAAKKEEAENYANMIQQNKPRSQGGQAMRRMRRPAPNGYMGFDGKNGFSSNPVDFVSSPNGALNSF